MPTSLVPTIFAFDDFELDVPAFELRRAGLSISMEPQVFEVLAFLVQNAGKVMTKDEILDHVWPERYVSEASLNSRVMSARKALGDSGSEQRYIKTVHGRGYRFTGTVASLEQPGQASPVMASRAHSMPSPGTSFVGRGTELARLDALLEQPSCRLLTITGPGGIGKTRLASEVAESLRAGTGSVVFIPLEHVAPERFDATLAAALGVQASGVTTAERVAQFLAANETTLILDNLEHVAAAARATIGAILRAARTSRVVVTSRVVLGMDQEWVFRVGGLSLDSDDGAPGEAEALFRERAAKAGSPLPAATAADNCREICALVDGMPLAIELAAALTQYLPVSGICELLERDGNAPFAAQSEGLPERQRGVQALFEENLRQLSSTESQALSALAVFHGAFDAPAAQAVAGAGLPELMALVDASLLQASEGRFDMHPLLRQFLLAGLADEDRLRHRHAEFYAARAEAHSASLQGAGQLAAMEAIDRSATNIVAAWRWSAQNGCAELLDRARQGLFTYLTFRARFAEAEELANSALAVLEEHVSPATTSGLLVNQAWALLRLGHTARGIAAVSRAIQVNRRAGIEWLPGFGADPRLVLVVARHASGDYPGAQATAEECLRLARKADDAAGVAFSAWLAASAVIRQFEVVPVEGEVRLYVYDPEGDPSRVLVARSYLDEAASILDPAEEVWLRGYLEIELGLYANATGQPERARAHYRNAYALRRTIDDPQGMASSLIYLADSLVGGGDAAAAMELHKEAAALLPRSADASGLAELRRSEGIAATAAGDYETARAKLREALELSRALGFANNVAGSLRALGDVFLLEGNTELAARIMAAVAADPSTTPTSRAVSRLILQRLGQAELRPEPMEALVDEAVRAAVSLRGWLASGAGPVFAGAA